MRSVAQSKGAPVARIGFLGPTSAESFAVRLDALREGLRERGYVDGSNIVIEVRFADGKYDRLPALAQELVRLKVDVIVTPGTPPTLAAKDATTSIPVVMTLVGDALATGIVSNLARPGGNVTGMTFFLPELSAKRVELLKEALPGLSDVAVLVLTTNPAYAQNMRVMQDAARAVNVNLFPLELGSADDLETGFARLAGRAQAVAKAIGFTVPRSILLRADQTIA